MFGSQSHREMIRISRTGFEINYINYSGDWRSKYDQYYCLPVSLGLNISSIDIELTDQVKLTLYYTIRPLRSQHRNSL